MVRCYSLDDRFDRVISKKNKYFIPISEIEKFDLVIINQTKIRVDFQGTSILKLQRLYKTDFKPAQLVQIIYTNNIDMLDLS
ncbi:hypothetical protein MASR2M54_10920 [Aliarcobacter cryaerophilus]